MLNAHATPSSSDNGSSGNVPPAGTPGAGAPIDNVTQSGAGAEGGSNNVTGAGLAPSPAPGGGDGEIPLSQRARVHVVSLLLALAGFGASIYALIEHLKLKRGAADLSCDVSNLVNCTKVIGSEYGEFAGIPLGGFGMAYFGVVAALALLPRFTEATSRWMNGWRLAAAAIGAAVSVSLAYISYVKIGAVCVVCSTVHALTVVNFVVVLVSFLRTRGQPSHADGPAFLKLVSTSLLFSVPPLVLGLISPSLPIGEAVGASDAEAGATKTPAVASTPFAKELLTFSKSDFVGKGQDYRRGNDNAKVVLVMFSDLECPHCQHASESVNKALSVVGEDKVLFVYRNYPLSNKCNPSVGAEGHAHACDLALAARCAGQQGKFWEFKDWAFTGIDMSPGERQAAFTAENIKAQAAKLGLDATRFSQCVDSKVEMPKIQEDVDVGNKLGLTGTPLLILNGRKYAGNISPEGFVSAFQAELAAVK